MSPFDQILDEMFDECLCVREFLVRLGFDPERIQLGMAEDLKHIGIVLLVQAKEIVFEIGDNLKPWSLDELHVAWNKKIAWIHAEREKAEFKKHFHEHVWLKSSIVEHAKEVIEMIVERGVVIPNLPFGGAPVAHSIRSGRWGIA